MATNPWTCLRTRARTLCTHATHAASAMVLCLGLTTTAASAAGGGGTLPLMAGPMNLTAEQQVALDDMASQADVIYEIASGQRPVLPFEPMVLDWFVLGEADLEPSELFVMSAAQIDAGAFAGGTLVSDPEAYMEVQFDAPVVQVWEDAGEAGPIPFAPADADEARVVSMGVVRGSLIGQEGAIDEVSFAVVGMEFWMEEGPMGAVGIVPIGIGVPWPEEEAQEVEQAELIITIIGTTAAVITIGAVVYGPIYGGPCRKTLKSLVDDCIAQCSPVYIACPPHGPCTLPLAIRRCLNCCNTVNDRYESRCKLGGFGSFGPVERLLDECVDHAGDFSHPLPGDIMFMLWYHGTQHGAQSPWSDPYDLPAE